MNRYIIKSNKPDFYFNGSPKNCIEDVIKKFNFQRTGITRLVNVLRATQNVSFSNGGKINIYIERIK